METTRRTKITFFSVVVTGALFFLIVNDVMGLNEKRKANSRIASEKPENSEFIEERFALAKLHLKRDEKNMALRILNDISQENISDEIRAKAFFNSANIYFRAAVDAKENFKTELVVPNLELAKLTYRKALEFFPGHRGARYNLERALQMAPELDFNVSDDSIRPERGERAVTTMKLQAIGMP
ncbi:hypothetical protein N9U60_01430 [Betaproteobacteria bacterium]|nr:hypothetical protein [Betaproteobacteria bacterium]